MRLREYEFMFIFDPVEEKIPGLKEAVKKYITDADGEIMDEKDMGMRKLAYHIKKRDQGFYYVVYCKLEPTKINTEIEREINLNEDILKYMSIRKTKEK